MASHFYEYRESPHRTCRAKSKSYVVCPFIHECGMPILRTYMLLTLDRRKTFVTQPRSMLRCLKPSRSYIAVLFFCCLAVTFGGLAQALKTYDYIPGTLTSTIFQIVLRSVIFSAYIHTTCLEHREVPFAFCRLFQATAQSS